MWKTRLILAYSKYIYEFIVQTVGSKLYLHATKLYKFFFIVRFLTLFYYLYEPTLGGETAFPVADNETIAKNGV